MPKINSTLAGSITFPSVGGGLTIINPSNISAGPAIWLAADYTDYGEGTLMATWADKSGNGNNAVQTDSNSWKPVYHKNVLNGYSAVAFDGIDDNMNIVTSSVALGTAFFILNGTPNVNGNFDRHNGLLGGATTDILIGANADTSNFATGGGAGSNIRINGSTTTNFAPLSDFKIVSCFDSTPATPTNLKLCQDKASGSRTWGGVLCEVIIYATVLSTTQIEQVEQYLRNKYLPNLTLGFE